MMEGRLYRRMKDGYIYEVVDRGQSHDGTPLWVLWNDRAGERQFAMDIELQRQVGWELVGGAHGAKLQEEAVKPIPAALMK